MGSILYQAAIFDNIEDSKDGWNIEIISIKDLATGEEIDIDGEADGNADDLADVRYDKSKFNFYQVDSDQIPEQLQSRGDVATGFKFEVKDSPYINAVIVRNKREDVYNLAVTENIKMRTRSLYGDELTAYSLQEAVDFAERRIVELFERFAENFKLEPFDNPRMPTAKALTFGKGSMSARTIEGGGWTNGHFVDLNPVPERLAKAFEDAHVNKRDIPRTRLEALMSSEDGEEMKIDGVIKYLGKGNIDTVILKGVESGDVLYFDYGYISHFVKQYGGVEFVRNLATAGTTNKGNSVKVKKDGKDIGVIMAVARELYDARLAALKWQNGLKNDDMPSESPKQPGQENDMVEKARQFAQDLVDGKYTTQDMIDGVMDDKLDWLIHLDGVDNDLLDKAFAAYADLA